MKKFFKALLIILLCAVLLLGAYFAYVFLAYKRIDDMQELGVTAPETAGSDAVAAGEPLKIVSYNVGFGAYSADYDFFMDGGTQSWAFSKEAVYTNIAGAVNEIKSAAPDFVYVQEVDIGGTRSYHVDERELIAPELPGYYYTFAQNYDSPFLCYPFNQPHGANKAGLMTFSKYEITSALRRSLPIENTVMKLVDLDRCYSVNRVPTDNGKELVLYNMHLSAYTSDGTIANEQLKMLCEDMSAEYAKGNYCIAGGDFNKDLLGDSGSIFGVAKSEYDTWAQPIPDGIIPEEFVLVAPFDESNPVASCRTASEPYNIETTFRITIDGFLISSNVELIKSDVIDAGYAWSDHNPVYMEFKLN